MAASATGRLASRRRLGVRVLRGSAAGILIALAAAACADPASESPAPAATPATVATVEATQPAPAASVAPLRAHIVTRGQTLAQLANEYDVPLADLVAWNEIQDPNLVLVGQTVMLEAPLPQSTQEPLRRAPAETEEGDPLVEWARGTWERMPVPDFGVTNEGVRNGITVAFVFLVASMVVLAAVVVLGLVRSVFRIATGRRPAEAEAGPPREPLLVYVGGVAPPAVERTVVPATPARHAQRVVEPAPETPVPANPAVGQSPRPSLEPPIAAPTAAVQPADGPQAARRAPSFDILRSPASRVAAATSGMRRGTSGLFAGRQRKEEERRREASLQRWWKHGTETLRIGLLDDAERHFLEGLQEAEQFGWDDERQLYEEALAHVAERRRALEASAGPAMSTETPATPEVDQG